jgi:hypothetical protein
VERERERKPDPLGVGWDDPIYDGTLAKASYDLRIAMVGVLAPLFVAAEWAFGRIRSWRKR